MLNGLLRVNKFFTLKISRKTNLTRKMRYICCPGQKVFFNISRNKQDTPLSSIEQ